MQYAQLGKSGPMVSRLGFGTWQTMGQSVDLKHSRDCVAAAYDSGITFFDTADVYGHGDAEKFLAECRLPRSKVLLGTKCFFPTLDGRKGLSRKHIFYSVENSLKNLKTDYLDIMQCHRFDPETPLEETIKAMQDLVSEGKIRHWGVSRWDALQMKDAIRLCANGPKPISNQWPYNLFNVSIEGELEKAAGELGFSLVAYSPLAQGILTGKYLDSKNLPANSRATNPEAKKGMWDFSEANLEKVAKLSRVAKNVGASLGQIALAWCLRKPIVGCVLIGASKPNQVIENVKALEYQLTDGQLAEIEVIMGRSVNSKVQ